MELKVFEKTEHIHAKVKMGEFQHILTYSVDTTDPKDIKVQGFFDKVIRINPDGSIMKPEDGEDAELFNNEYVWVEKYNSFSAGQWKVLPSDGGAQVFADVNSIFNAIKQGVIVLK